MFSAEQLPVKRAVSENFAVFNKYFTSVPSSSYPNHLMAQSATSCESCPLSVCVVDSRSTLPTYFAGCVHRQAVCL